MTRTVHRLGLSFEIAPPRAAHPNRTDIACFVGNVARRRVALTGAVAMPAVLAQWLAGLGFVRLGGQDVASINVDLASSAAWQTSVLAAADSDQRAALADAMSFAALDSATALQRRQQLAELVDACRTLSPIGAELIDDLAARAWVPQRLLGPDELAGWLRVQRLTHLPIAIDAFDTFDQLFDWRAAPVRAAPIDANGSTADPTADPTTDPTANPTTDPTVAAPLGAALRAFFGEGGRRCWIVRSGDPAPLFAPVATRANACSGQVPGVSPRLDAAAWQGLEHVYGLAEVSFACLPDIVSACAPDIPAELPPADQLGAAEVFHECVAEAAMPAASAGRRLPAPALDAAGLVAWRTLVGRALDLLANGGRAFHRRDVQLLASLPLSNEAPSPAGLASDRLQLAYPWLRTADSDDCPGGVEAPEGTLAGVLARGALQRGAFRSIANLPVTRYLATQPALTPPMPTERLCVIGPSPRGAVLLSDVTTSDDAAMRQGAVRRLLNVVMQAARIAGDEFAFEPNGPALWQRLRERLGDLGRVLLAAGALSTDGVPFSVRCGRDTMTQADLDAGRLIAEVALLAAQPIQRIVVVLAMRDAAMSANAQSERQAA